MDFQIFFSDIKDLIVKPRLFFSKKSESKEKSYIILTTHLVPLISLWLVLGIFGNIFFGLEESFFYKSAQILTHIISFLSWAAVTIFILTKICGFMNLDSKTSTAVKVVSYSLTPVILANTISSIHYNFNFIWLFGLYSIYLFWVGIEVNYKTNEEKKTVLVIATICISIIAKLICDLIFSIIFIGLNNAQSFFVS